MIKGVALKNAALFFCLKSILGTKPPKPSFSACPKFLFFPSFIQFQLGHASIQTTFDRCGHLLPVKADQVGARLDAAIFGGDDKVSEMCSLPAVDRHENNCQTR